MPTALYTTDVQKITDRTTKTTLTDTDVFVVANSSGTLAPITKVNAKKTLGIDDAETALTTVKGTGWTDENLVDHEDRITQNESDIADLEGEGRTTETVKGNADAIALRELLSNKKTTLADNSDTFYPTQKAVKTAVDTIKGDGWDGQTIKGNADAIATLQGYTKVSLGQETVERVTQATQKSLPILVCADGGALINLNGSLIKYNAAMEAQWTRTSFAAIYGREAPDGKLWLTNTDGVYVLTDEGIDVTSFTDEGDCRDIALDADGNFYTCHYRSSGKTLIKRDPDGVELWSKSVVPNGISVDIDISGNIWMCGYATGVSCYKYAPDGTQLATITRTHPICIRTGLYDRIVVMASSNTQFYDSSGTVIVPSIARMAGYTTSWYSRFSIIGRYIYGGSPSSLIKIDWDGNIVWEYRLVSSNYGRGAITNGNGLVYGGRASTGEDSFVVLREYHPINWRG